MIEYIFDIPGMGTLSMSALNSRDLPLMVGLFSFTGFLTLTSILCGHPLRPCRPAHHISRPDLTGRKKSLRGAIFPEDCQHFRHCQHRAQLVDHDSIRAAPEDRL